MRVLAVLLFLGSCACSSQQLLQQDLVNAFQFPPAPVPLLTGDNELDDHVSSPVVRPGFLPVPTTPNKQRKQSATCLDNGESLTCHDVAMSNLCGLKLGDGRRLFNLCPESCDRSCCNIDDACVCNDEDTLQQIATSLGYPQITRCWMAAQYVGCDQHIEGVEHTLAHLCPCQCMPSPPVTATVSVSPAPSPSAADSSTHTITGITCPSGIQTFVAPEGASADDIAKLGCETCHGASCVLNSSPGCDVYLYYPSAVSCPDQGFYFIFNVPVATGVDSCGIGLTEGSVYCSCSTNGPCGSY